MNRLSIAVNVSDHLQGSLDAPRVLVQYGDYECSACGAAFSIVKRLQEYLGDKLLFVYRNFCQSALERRQMGSYDQRTG